MPNTLLASRMLIAVNNVKNLVEEINKIEANTQIPIMERLSIIKKIREEMTKVSGEIDNIKREFTLLTAHNIN
jgi:hypothetical protein